MTTRTTIFATNDNVSANDLNALAGAWNSWTPTVAQGSSSDIAKTIDRAKYLQFGKLVIASFKLSLTASGTAGSAVSVSLPVPAVTTAFIGGHGLIYQTNNYPTLLWIETTSVIHFYQTDVSNNSPYGASPNVAVASATQLIGSLLYEAA